MIKLQTSPETRLGDWSDADITVQPLETSLNFLLARALVRNVFCATGEGGGVDPTCSPGGTRLAGLESRLPSVDFQGLSYTGMLGSGNKSQYLEKRLGSVSKQLGLKMAVKIVGDDDFEGRIKEQASKMGARVKQVGAYYNKPSDTIFLRSSKVARIDSPTAFRLFVQQAFHEIGHAYDREVLSKTAGVKIKTVEDYYASEAEQSADEIGAKITLAWKPHKRQTHNVFCPTGEGGGVDPSCSPGASGSTAERLKQGFAGYGAQVKIEPGYQYHVTTDDRLYDIVRRGKLLPHKPNYGTDQDAWPDGSVDRRSYFTDSGPAWEFAPEGGKPVALRIKTSKHFRKESTGDVYTTKAIKARRIEVALKDGTWIPIESLRSESS